MTLHCAIEEQKTVYVLYIQRDPKREGEKYERFKILKSEHRSSEDRKAGDLMMIQRWNEPSKNVSRTIHPIDALIDALHH